MILSLFAASLAVWMWTIIAALFIGIFIGGLARLAIPGKQKMSFGATWIIGVTGALLGAMVADIFGFGNTDGVDWIKLAVQIAIAAVMVGVYSGWFFTKHQ